MFNQIVKTSLFLFFAYDYYIQFIILNRRENMIKKHKANNIVQIYVVKNPRNTIKSLKSLFFSKIARKASLAYVNGENWLIFFNHHG